MTNTHTVLAVFNNRQDAEGAINDLEHNGYNPKDISIMMTDSVDRNVIVENTGASVAEGAVSGATTGAVVGGLAGLLIGIGAIAIPGIGGLLIGGPLAVALGLTGAAATTVSGAATGALAGGLLGALVNIGVPEEQARVYEDHVRAGGILVAVPATSDRIGKVKEALEDFNAKDLNVIDLREEYRDHYAGHTGLTEGRRRERRAHQSSTL